MMGGIGSHSCPNSFFCDICYLIAFKDRKALDQHRRKKHRYVSPLNDLVPDTSVCPTCGSDFRNRFRLISHLSDQRVRSRTRRTCCHIEFMKPAPQPLPEQTRVRLRVQQTEAFPNVWSAGHTHVIAHMPSLRGRPSVLKHTRGAPSRSILEPRRRITGKRGASAVGLTATPTCRRRLHFKQPSSAPYLWGIIYYLNEFARLNRTVFRPQRGRQNCRERASVGGTPTCYYLLCAKKENDSCIQF